MLNQSDGLKVGRFPLHGILARSCVGQRLLIIPVEPLPCAAPTGRPRNNVAAEGRIVPLSCAAVPLSVPDAAAEP